MFLAYASGGLESTMRIPRSVPSPMAIPVAGEANPAIPPVRPEQAASTWPAANLPRPVIMPAQNAPTAGGLPPLSTMLADPAFPSLDPLLFRPPPAVVDVIAKAQHIVVVGHADPPPDIDAVGSALGLTHALRIMGKDVDIILDGPLSGPARTLDARRECHRASELEDVTPDLVILVDVADRTRIGDATGVLDKAANVVVVDHHHADTGVLVRSDLDAEHLVSWVDTEADAAALMVLRLVAALTESMDDGMAAQTWTTAVLPCCAGALTDTAQFSFRSVHAQSVSIFKHVLLTHLDGALDTVRNAYHYVLPARAAGVLEVPLVMPEGIDPVMRQRVEERVAKGEVLTVEHHAQTGLGILTVPKCVMDMAVDVARLDDPQVSRADILDHLKRNHLPAVTKASTLAVMLEDTGEEVVVEARAGHGTLALDLARALGGGGHPCAAGASVRGTMEQARHRVVQWMELQASSKDVLLRVKAGL